MQQEYEFEVVSDASAWELAMTARPPERLDNRVYAVAALASWTDATNRAISAAPAVEVQPVPDSFSAGYRDLLG